jgi:hypothetical protein
MNRVQLLKPIIDNPRFSGLELLDPLRDERGFSIVERFFGFGTSDPEDITRPHWFNDGWTPLPVRNPLPSQVNDYPCVDLRIPAFSRRAVDALRPLLEANGELLPLKCQNGDFVTFNPTVMSDALRIDGSDIDWFFPARANIRSPRLARSIRFYDFAAPAVEKLAIFRLPIDPFTIYATDEFVRAVEHNSLQGFHFELVWPLKRPPKGSVMEAERRAGH